MINNLLWSLYFQGILFCTAAFSETCEIQLCLIRWASNSGKDDVLGWFFTGSSIGCFSWVFSSICYSDLPFQLPNWKNSEGWASEVLQIQQGMKGYLTHLPDKCCSSYLIFRLCVRITITFAYRAFPESAVADSVLSLNFNETLFFSAKLF